MTSLGDVSVFDVETRNSFVQGVERFVDQRYNFETHRRLAATPERFGRAEWAQMAALGWQCLPLPPEHDGLGAGATDTGLIMEAIGRGLLLEPYLASIVLAGRLIAACATPAQCARLLPGLAAGDLLLALADRNNDTAQPVCATLAAGSWMLSGAKTLALHADVADQLLVAAEVDGVTALFLVAATAPGVARDGYVLVDGRGIAEVRFDAVAAELLGDGESDARAALVDANDHAANACCFEAIGAMAALNAQTVEFAKTRQQFGVAIGSFQALQHRLVDMTIAEQEVRSITRAAALALDSGQPGAGLLVAAAKVRAARAGRFIGESAVQIHGGIGMSSELPVGAWFKRLLAIESLFGDSDAQLDRLAVARDAA